MSVSKRSSDDPLAIARAAHDGALEEVLRLETEIARLEAEHRRGIEAICRRTGRMEAEYQAEVARLRDENEHLLALENGDPSDAR